MKNCTGCKHAEWKRNAAGNLHPSGVGLRRPTPDGGHINRRDELSDHCVYFAKEQACN
jgi:hypothetical protein